MVLSTPAYFVFLAAIFFTFWFVDRYRTAGLAVILFANYFFYARWDLAYLAIIPLASTCDFFIGQALHRSESPTTRRALVAGSVALNSGLIVSLKYLPLPLALSFYAFQSMTYTIDIFRRDAEATTDYLAYLCSASFFPTTLAGPITRLSNLIPQLRKDRFVDARDGATALYLIGIGLTKKLLIADFLAENLINRVFDTPKLYSGGEALIAVYGYAFQLYCDFSGYTDIAIGSAMLLGIRLPANFNQPYVAANIADFWRRWHITLSNWLRDYLYFSLPGVRHRFLPYLNLIVTMAIGGLWHGASWTFLVWGLIHGVGLAGLRGLQVLRRNSAPSTNPAIHVLKCVATFHFVCFAWIFFRASSLSAAGDVLKQIASLTFSFGNLSAGFLVVLAVAIASHYFPRTWTDFSQRLFVHSPAYVQAGAMALLVLAIQYVATTGAAPFIYTRF
jgi:D-alanyl-lipoteichoic acid acyltransferase DltB (MBOAT superfamily)